LETKTTYCRLVDGYIFKSECNKCEFRGIRKTDEDRVCTIEHPLNITSDKTNWIQTICRLLKGFSRW
jgi:hypothetical protein